MLLVTAVHTWNVILARTGAPVLICLFFVCFGFVGWGRGLEGGGGGVQTIQTFLCYFLNVVVIGVGLFVLSLFLFSFQY